MSLVTQVVNGVQYIRVYGRWYRVTAKFSFIAAANAYMEKRPQEGVIQVCGDDIYLARIDDCGIEELPQPKGDNMTVIREALLRNLDSMDTHAREAAAAYQLGNFVDFKYEKEYIESLLNAAEELAKQDLWDAECKKCDQ